MKKLLSLFFLASYMYLQSCKPENNDPCRNAFLISDIEINNPYTGFSNGKVTITATPDSGVVYKLNERPETSDSVFNNLGPGKYTITAKSPTGCVSTREITIKEVEACSQAKFEVSVLSQTHPTSAFVNDGTIRGSARGDMTGVTFKIIKPNGVNASSPTGVFGGLGAGLHTLIASNSFGCIDTAITSLTAGNPCPSRPLSINATTTSFAPCETRNSGEIRVQLIGSSFPPFTYSIVGPNINKSFSTTNIYSNLVAGTYTIVGRDRDACQTASTNVTVTRRTSGTYFAGVRSILLSTSTCSSTNSSCHGGNLKAPRFSDDCVIVSNNTGIYAKALGRLANHTGSTHPALSTTQKELIIKWYNAGGKYPN